MAVITAPGSSAALVVAAAGGSLLDSVDPAVVIGIDDESDFSSRLYAAGAWLVIDARAALFCLRRDDR